MGLLMGDVLATVAIIVLSGLAAWAGGLLAALLFPERTEQASFDFEYRAWSTFFIGLGAMAVVGFVAVVLYGPPPTRPIGAFVFMAMLGVALFGTGGLFRLVARRVRRTGGSQSDYGALARAGLLLTCAELLPFFGWFLLLPFVLISSFGAGCRAVFFYRRRHSAVEAPPPAEAQ